MKNTDYYHRLSTLVPLNSLRRHQFDQVFAEVEFLSIPAGTVLFHKGDMEPDLLYLLQGKVELSIDDDARPSVLASDGEEADYPIAQLRPRRFTGRALTDLYIAKVPQLPLERALAIEQVVSGSRARMDEVLVEELKSDEARLDGDSTWTRDLLSSSIFSKVPLSELGHLLASMEPVSVPRRTVVIREGDPGDYYYVIRKGRFAVSRTDANGEIRILTQLGEGGVFGEEALVANRPRNATVLALQDSELMRLPKDAFDALLKPIMLDEVSLEQARELLAGGARMLDLRLPSEHRHESETASVNIPLSELRRRIAELDKHRCYLLCCKDSARSLVGAFLLNQRGFDVRLIVRPSR